MLLVLDIGNTQIKTGLFDGGKLRNSWRLATDLRRTSDEYGMQMESFFGHLNVPTSAIDGIMISSVVPSINYTIEHMCSLFFANAKVMQVSHTLNLGIQIRYDRPELLGTDRICNAVAALDIYGGPAIVVDFGTATTFSVVSADGVFLGGEIAPGIIVSTDALIERTAMLHKVEFIKPEYALATNTRDAMQAGIINGYVGLVAHIIARIERELPSEPLVIATGGMSSMIAAETDRIDVLNPTLTLEGLALIYERNP